MKELNPKSIDIVVVLLSFAITDIVITITLKVNVDVII